MESAQVTTPTRRTRATRRAPCPPTATSAPVIPFRQIPADVLLQYEAYTKALRIPDYFEAKQQHRSQLNAYWRGAGKPAGLSDQIERAWSGFANRHRLSPQAIREFRDSHEYNNGLNAIEEWWEAGAYMLGLWVARREYPRLELWTPNGR